MSIQIQLPHGESKVTERNVFDISGLNIKGATPFSFSSYHYGEHGKCIHPFLFHLAMPDLPQIKIPLPPSGLVFIHSDKSTYSSQGFHGYFNLSRTTEFSSPKHIFLLDKHVKSRDKSFTKQFLENKSITGKKFFFASEDDGKTTLITFLKRLVMATSLRNTTVLPVAEPEEKGEDGHGPPSFLQALSKLSKAPTFTLTEFTSAASEAFGKSFWQDSAKIVETKDLIIDFRTSSFHSFKERMAVSNFVFSFPKTIDGDYNVAFYKFARHYCEVSPKFRTSIPQGSQKLKGKFFTHSFRKFSPDGSRVLVFIPNSSLFVLGDTEENSKAPNSILREFAMFVDSAEISYYLETIFCPNCEQDHMIQNCDDF